MIELCFRTKQEEIAGGICGKMLRKRGSETEQLFRVKGGKGQIKSTDTFHEASRVMFSFETFERD